MNIDSGNEFTEIYVSVVLKAIRHSFKGMYTARLALD